MKKLLVVVVVLLGLLVSLIAVGQYRLWRKDKAVQGALVRVEAAEGSWPYLRFDSSDDSCPPSDKRLFQRWENDMEAASEALGRVQRRLGPGSSDLESLIHRLLNVKNDTARLRSSCERLVSVRKEKEHRKEAAARVVARKKEAAVRAAAQTRVRADRLLRQLNHTKSLLGKVVLHIENGECTKNISALSFLRERETFIQDVGGLPDKEWLSLHDEYVRQGRLFQQIKDVCSLQRAEFLVMEVETAARRASMCEPPLSLMKAWRNKMGQAYEVIKQLGVDSGIKDDLRNRIGETLSFLVRKHRTC